MTPLSINGSLVFPLLNSAFNFNLYFKLYIQNTCPIRAYFVLIADSINILYTIDKHMCSVKSTTLHDTHMSRSIFFYICQGYSLKALEAYYKRSPFIVNSCMRTIMTGNFHVLWKGVRLRYYCFL